MNRMRKITLAILAGGLLGLAFVPMPTNREFEISKNLEIFANLYRQLNNGYVDELDPGVLMRTGLEAMVGSLDPFTNYIAESDIERYRIIQEGSSSGVGLSFRMVGKTVTVTEVFQDMAADKSGVQPGDQITAIDGRAIAGRNAEEVDYLLRGYAGSSVELTLQRPVENKELKVKLQRDEREAPNVPFSDLLDGDVAYVSLTTFTANAGRNVANALRDLRLKNPNLKGAILDLRGNGGGLLNEAVNVCNVFIPANQIVVTTKGKEREMDRSYRTGGEAFDTDLPLAVIIDKGSASASEIVSGVMQDYDRGVLIGQRSYGKGLVQNTVDIGYNARLKLTISKYYIPSGRCIQSVEYQNGEPVDIADNRRAEFKTKNGRPVLDGGGVSPDIRVEQADNIPVVRALVNQGIILNYVTGYCAGKASMPPVESLQFTDFEDFIGYLNREKITLQTETEKLLEKLREHAGKEGYEMNAPIDALEKSLSEAQLNLIRKNKDLLVQLIEKEIAGRYYYQSGRIRMGLARDKEIAEAIRILKDPPRYKQVLAKQ
ncbi:MAG: S41 family peptidase [Haliscomenobacter sp.]|nr:S41 family peptidase [Haliscomenobacter sp.]